MKWVEVDTKVKGYGRDIIYAKDMFWLAHYEPSGIAYSSDLKKWIDIKLDDSKFKLTNLAYGNDLFMASGMSGSEDKTYIAMSKDGINWNYKQLDIQTTSKLSLNINSCKFINNRFIFIAGFSSYNTLTNIRTNTILIYETLDGQNITIHKYVHQTIGDLKYGIMDIDYNNNLYVLVGENGFIITSPDLKSWTVRNSTVNCKLVGIAYGKNMFVITGANGTILTSENGVNWYKQKSNTASYLIRSRYGNGTFVAVGYNGTILTSINGIDWIEEQDNFVRTVMYGVVFANNYYVISAGRYSSTGTIPITYSQISRELTYSNDESLYIFDKKLNFLGVIDQFISLRWRRKYYEAGEFELIVAPYQNNINLLSKKDNIIIRQDYNEAALIDTVEFNDDGNNVQLKVSGNFLSYLTKRRIIRKIINFKGNIIEGQKQLLREMTALTDDFEIEPTSIDSNYVEFQCSYKNVYEYLCKLSKLSNVGFRIVPNIENKVYRFENFVGLNRSSQQSLNERYVFSTVHNNLEKSNYIDTLIDKCNYVLVGGVGEGTSRTLVEVKNGDHEGFDLFETFLDAKNESNNNLSSSEYKNVLETRGKEKLNDETKNIEFTAISNDYRTKWDLGDIVDVEIVDWNIKETLRITEVEETIENGKRAVYPTFGQPLAEKIELD